MKEREGERERDSSLESEISRYSHEKYIAEYTHYKILNHIHFKIFRAEQLEYLSKDQCFNIDIVIFLLQSINFLFFL